MEPEAFGSTVVLISGEICTTARTLEKSRKGGFSVYIEKLGFRSVEAQVAKGAARSEAADMACNGLSGGLIDVAVEADSRAMEWLLPGWTDVKPRPMRDTFRRQDGDARND